MDPLGAKCCAALLFMLLLAGGSLEAPLSKWNAYEDEDSFPLELLYDPGPVQEHLTLLDDYGVKPAPPFAMPPVKSTYQGTYQPRLEHDYY